jgi:hypothetical protein
MPPKSVRTAGRHVSGAFVVVVIMNNIKEH